MAKPYYWRHEREHRTFSSFSQIVLNPGDETTTKKPFSISHNAAKLTIFAHRDIGFGQAY
jgi:hypothetical protein